MARQDTLLIGFALFIAGGFIFSLIILAIETHIRKKKSRKQKSP